MIIIPEDYEFGKVWGYPTSNGITYICLDRDGNRLQITLGVQSFFAFWTPNEPAGDCLSRLHTSQLLAGKESWLKAEFTDGRKIYTQDWKPALETVSACDDSELKSVELSSANGRSIIITSLSDDNQLDIGISAELSQLSSIKDALLLTAAPKTVKVAFNQMAIKCFPLGFRHLHFQVDSPLDKHYPSP